MVSVSVLNTTYSSQCLLTHKYLQHCSFASLCMQYTCKSTKLHFIYTLLLWAFFNLAIPRWHLALCCFFEDAQQLPVHNNVYRWQKRLPTSNLNCDFFYLTLFIILCFSTLLVWIKNNANTPALGMDINIGLLFSFIYYNAMSKFSSLNYNSI